MFQMLAFIWKKYRVLSKTAHYFLKVLEEEIKKAYMDWSEKGVSYLNCMCVYDIMMDVDEALQTCDTILDEIDYTSRKKQS